MAVLVIKFTLFPSHSQCPIENQAQVPPGQGRAAAGVPNRVIRFRGRRPAGIPDPIRARGCRTARQFSDRPLAAEASEVQGHGVRTVSERFRRFRGGTAVPRSASAPRLSGRARCQVDSRPPAQTLSA
eukprot:114424-Hanusia_phi.AAC.1